MQTNCIIKVYDENVGVDRLLGVTSIAIPQAPSIPKRETIKLSNVPYSGMLRRKQENSTLTVSVLFYFWSLVQVPTTTWTRCIASMFIASLAESSVDFNLPNQSFDMTCLCQNVFYFAASCSHSHSYICFMFPLTFLKSRNLFK